ncbi:MAG TPA: cytochrome C oxidase subunit IV family protein [Blastocatellia bacterium]|nr:cytochrome C oxidase subunit IV family protein [Blastocatellia bacterium]
MAEHVVPVRIYLVIFLSLIVLTAVTVIVANFDLGSWNAIVALSIAVFKATLVVLYFMHVRYGSRLTWVFVGAGLVWLIILVSFTLSDYLTRGWMGISTG